MIILFLFFNERLSRHSLRVIRDTFIERVSDYKHNKEPELIQLFINSIDKFCNGDEKGSIYLGGTGELILQPDLRIEKF